MFQRLVMQPSQPHVLAFWGLNGIGKTYLLRYLYHHYRRLPTVPGHLAAWLGFNPNNSLVQAPQGLWYLRGQLLMANTKFRFTRFDILWATLWEHKNNLPISANKDFSPGERKFLEEVLSQADTVAGNVIPFFSIISGLIRMVAHGVARRQKNTIYRSVQAWFEQHAKNRGSLNLQTAFELQDQRVINEWLPRAFMADLAEWSRQFATPLIFFIDGYDVLRSQTNQQRNTETHTFVQILAEEALAMNANIVFVIASTEPLHWGQIQLSDGTWITNTTSLWTQELLHADAISFVSTHIEEYSIDYLSENDALGYLTQRRHVNPEIAHEIYTLTKGYPFALGTVVDILKDPAQNTEADLTALRVRLQRFQEFSPEWRAELENWFLHKLLEQLDVRDSTFKRLIWVASIPRLFTAPLLAFLSPDYVIQDDFNRLVSYAFVEPNIGQQSYRLHSGIRELILHTIRDDGTKMEWEAKAREWFIIMSAKDETYRYAYQIEALYHLWHLDPVAALAEIEMLFDDPTISQLDMRWSLLNTTVGTDHTLPSQIRIQLKLYAVELYLLTFVRGKTISTSKHMALQTVEDALTLADQSGHESLLGAIYAAQADVLQSMQRFAAAVQAARKACEVAQSLGDHYSLAHGLGLRATLESQDNPEFGDITLLQQAFALFSLDHFERKPFKERKVILFILWNQAQLALRFENWEVLEQTLATIQQIKLNTYEQMKVKQFYGEAYVQQGRVQEAIPNLKDAQRLGQQLQYTPGICAASGWLGLAFFMQGHDEEGLRNLHNALQIEHDTLDSQEGVAKWLMYLAELVYMKRGEYDRAFIALLGAYTLQSEFHHIHADRSAKQMEEIRRQIGDDKFLAMQNSLDLNQSEFAAYLKGDE